MIPAYIFRSKDKEIVLWMQKWLYYFTGFPQKIYFWEKYANYKSFAVFDVIKNQYILGSVKND